MGSTEEGKQGKQKREGFQLSLQLLKWLAVVLPLLFMAGVDVLRREVFGDRLNSFPALFTTYAFVAVAIIIFSYTIFGFIGRLQRRIVEQNRQLSALNTIAKTAAEKMKLETLLDASLDPILANLRADAGLICVVDMEKQEHTAVCSRGFSPEMVARLQRAKFEDTPIAQQVVRTGRPVIRERIFDNPGVSETAKREGIRSSITAPLISEGDVSGILLIANHQERHFSQGDQDFLAGIGGQLGLAIRNAMLFEESQLQNRELGALLAVGKVVTSSFDTDEIVGASLDNIIAVTSADAAEVWLAEDDGDMVLHSHRGAFPEAFLERQRFQVGEGIPGMVAQKREPIIIRDLPSDARFLRGGVVEAGFHTLCALPLWYQNKVVGVLTAASLKPGTLDNPRELRLLEGIREWLAIAVENARLYQQVGNLAVLEERERIAREMHDGLAQVLAYINAQTSSISRNLADGRLEEAHQEIRHLREAARGVYADIREAILGLRLASVQPGQMWQALKEYTENFSLQTGISVSWKGLELAQRGSLEPSAETQLMRIVQEALTNVRKHAIASRVKLSINNQDGSLSIAVEDDGKGFNVDEPRRDGQNHFGLDTMRERAESVGGTFHLESAIGIGTTVTVTVSVPAQKTEVT